jgi:hypothetical protein
MIRLILVAFVVLLFTVSAIFVALIQFWGWKGLLAFPFVMALLGWILYIVIRRSFQRLLLGLFSLKSRVLRGAKLTVHSITPTAKPAGRDSKDEEPRDYVDIDLTITPKNSEDGRVWEPGELILTSKKIRSLAELEEGEAELGTVHDVKIWDGKEFGPDDPGKYPGAQRLKLTFAVKPGASKAWLHYYAETIGVLELPRQTTCA